VAILRLLLKKNSCICGDIVEELPLSQSTVSQHLKELKEAGLIKGEIDGVKICYCIDEAEWKRARQILDELFGTYQPIKSCC
jgi:DNA-binding transcriptional ArsR family regulator